MASWIGRDEDLRKHGEERRFGSKAHRLFGIIKVVYHKLNGSKSATIFPVGGTIKELKSCQMEFEHKKAEAIVELYRHKTFLR